MEKQVNSTLVDLLLNLTPSIILVLDEEEKIIRANQEYQKLAREMPAEALLLKPLKEQLGDKWLRHEASNFVHQEICLYGDLPRWFSCSGNWFFEDRQNYLLLVATEITQLKRLQEEVRMSALRALLAEEELTGGIRETLAGVIHQLQAPLNLIAAAVNRLKRQVGPQDPLCSLLQETLATSKQALDKLHQGIPQPLEKAVMPVNVNELLSEVLSLSTQHLLAAGVVIDWKPALILPSLLGHVGPLRSMFKQLIYNAVEAMKGVRQQRELRIRTFSHDAELISVIIEDTGPGIPEELRFKVFEPFFTSKKMGNRVGMGLTAVQEVVNLHAGTIQIDSTYSEGCRVILHLPTTHTRNQ